MNDAMLYRGDAPHDDKDYNNYNDLILNHNHLKKGECFKGKSILYDDENIELTTQILCDVIRESNRR